MSGFKLDPILEPFSRLMFGTRETLQQTYDLAKQVSELEGDLVECGIAAGAQICAMKRACPHKMIWGYDSFEGIQLAGPKDTEQPGIGRITHDVNVHPNELLRSSGITNCSWEWVTNEALPNMGMKADDFILVKGWIQNTLEENCPDKIALLRLDMDIYEPTFFALMHLWPRLVDGGILIIDDWNLEGVRLACEDALGERTWIHGTSNPVYLIK